MPRGIKFRARNADGKWVYGVLNELWDNGKEDILPLRLFFTHIERGNLNINTLGVFTGLLDANGKEIYEGDILSFASHQRGVKPFVVRWDTMTDFGDWSPKDKAEKIGNIHEHPELLKMTGGEG